MSHKALVGLTLLSVLSYGYAQDEINYDAPVQYVKICANYGDGYFFIPGSDSCQQSSTGIVKHESANGTVISETQLAHRVSVLERKIASLLKDKE